MAHDVFISYSSKNQEAADIIRAGLEAAGIKCWIASRDLATGTQWGGSIIHAIQNSKALLIVFNEHANVSPQVIRELEAAVGRRVPLIPVRIEDVQPNEDMQYFLGVSHWFNAYPQPLAGYLPQIVEATRRVMAGEPVWQRALRRLPGGRRGQIAAVAGGLALLVFVAWLMQPSALDPMAMLRSPMAGRWQATLPDANGRTQSCLLDVQDLGEAAFSDTCPFPLSGARATLVFTPDGAMAPQVFQRDRDTGTFTYLGGSLHGIAGAYRLNGRNGLITRDPQRGEITWKRVSGDGPLRNAGDGVLPARVDWPVKDVPALAQRATTYVRSHWQKDAVLLNLELKLSDAPNASIAQAQTPSGGIEARFQFYSNGTQHALNFSPNAGGGSMHDMGAVDRDVRRALPDRFRDLPDVVTELRQRGMRAREIKAAALEWSTGPACGSFRETNAIVPPCGNTPRYRGVQWMITSALNEREYVPALAR